MIFLDLDGVFADFSGAAASLHGKWGTKIEKWNFFLDWKLTPKMFWDKINAEGDDFYGEQVLPYPWAKDLLLAVQETDDFMVLTNAACNTPCGYASKRAWVDKYLQPHVVDHIKVMVGSEKHLLAGKDRVLLDDYDENINSFRCPPDGSVGGYAITFPQLWNTQRRQASNGLRYVKNQLQQWKDMQLHELRKKEISKKVKRVYPPGDSPGY